MVFISGDWLGSRQTKEGLDAVVRGSAGAKSTEQGTRGAGEMWQKGDMGLPVGWRPTGASCCQRLLQPVQKLQSSLEHTFLSRFPPAFRRETLFTWGLSW